MPMIYACPRGLFILTLFSGTGPQVSSVVAQGILMGVEMSRLHSAYDQNIADNRHKRGRGRRCQPEWAYFSRGSGKKAYVGTLGEFASVIPGNDDEFQFGHQVRSQLKKFEYFASFPRVGDDQHQIVFCNMPKSPC